MRVLLRWGLVASVAGDSGSGGAGGVALGRVPGRLADVGALGRQAFGAGARVRARGGRGPGVLLRSDMPQVGCPSALDVAPGPRPDLVPAGRLPVEFDGVISEGGGAGRSRRFRRPCDVVTGRPVAVVVRVVGGAVSQHGECQAVCPVRDAESAALSKQALRRWPLAMAIFLRCVGQRRLGG